MVETKAASLVAWSVRLLVDKKVELLVEKMADGTVGCLVELLVAHLVVEWVFLMAGSLVGKRADRRAAW